MVGDIRNVLYTGKDVEFLVLLVGDFPQQPILSLSHASTPSQQPNLTNMTTAHPVQQDTTTHNWLKTAATRACCTQDM